MLSNDTGHPFGWLHMSFPPRWLARDLGLRSVSQFVIPTLVTCLVATHPAAAQDGELPLLTKSGQKWAKKVVKNARRIVDGKSVDKPPFVSEPVALALAQLLRIEKAAAQTAKRGTDADDLVQSEDFQDLLAVVSGLATGGSALDANLSEALITALNEEAEFYPPLALRAKRGREALTTFASTLEAAAIVAKRTEKNSDGLRLAGTQLVASDSPQDSDIDFVNGIKTQLSAGVTAAVLLSEVCDRQVGHIHNRSGSTFGDVVQTLKNAAKIDKSDAVRATRDQILQHAGRHEPYVLLCHSQGAAICAQAASEAIEQVPEMSTAISACTQIVTLGGFAKPSSFPDELQSNLQVIINSGDPVPPAACAIDFRQPFRAVKSLIQALAKTALGGVRDHGVPAYIDSLAGPDDEFCNHIVNAEGALRECLCGNGTTEGDEECDDGNNDPCDGCSPECTTEQPVCGNSCVEPPEMCDGPNFGPNGAPVNGLCSSDCTNRCDGEQFDIDGRDYPFLSDQGCFDACGTTSGLASFLGTCVAEGSGMGPCRPADGTELRHFGHTAVLATSDMTRGCSGIVTSLATPDLIDPMTGLCTMYTEIPPAESVCILSGSECVPACTSFPSATCVIRTYDFADGRYDFRAAGGPCADARNRAHGSSDTALPIQQSVWDLAR